MKKIILTGGGSAGHVTPNLALITELKKEGWEIHYIGTEDGIEKGIIAGTNVKYHAIQAGKLRRYFNIKNITDPFKVIYGVFQASRVVRKVKPNVIFSKGGFVSVPVVIGGWVNRVPVIIHESDITPGLANKLAAPFASKICTNFEAAAKNFNMHKSVCTGTPIRKELAEGNYRRGLELCGFDESKPVIMIMGGSIGSKKINGLVRESLPRLLNQFQIVHICGKGNIDNNLLNKKGYKQFEYISEEQPHIFKIASLVVSRAGANSIFEFLMLKLPSILIPLSMNASRGDQILNSREFEKMGFSKVLQEEEINSGILCDTIQEVYNNRKYYIENMNKQKIPDGTREVMKLINLYSNK